MNSNLKIKKTIDQPSYQQTNKELPDFEKPKKSKQTNNFNRKLRQNGWKILVAGILSLVLCFSSFTKDPGGDTQKALQEGQSNQLIIGAKLSESDVDMEARDYTITHTSKAEYTTIWVWDYADEDGDYIKVLVDGTPITDAFMIKNKVVQLKVPTTGQIEVLGVRDGVGGISYAIHFELNGTTYFNKANVGEHNTYTLIKNS